MQLQHNGPLCLPKCYSATYLVNVGRNCISSESVNPGVTNEEMGRFKGPTCFVCGVRGTLQDGLSEAEKINNTVLLRLECQLLQVKVYSVGHARTEPRFQCRDGYVPSQQPLLLLSYLYCAIGDLCPLH
ncbi:hypothetical protein Tco_1069137 [Tanacetum coccineum]|uniref:Uncharacterized protein n=1 Tax=Tanacetum coccineum TaxID=301880 RepID=A0ABQ5HJL1_9ASTR